MQHPISKRRFGRTNKNNFVKQIAQQEARDRYIRCLYNRIIKARPEIADADIKRSTHGEHNTNTSDHRKRSSDPDEQLPYTDPHDHHHIAKSQRAKIELATWLHANRLDPAFKVRAVHIPVSISVSVTAHTILGFHLAFEGPHSVSSYGCRRA